MNSELVRISDQSHSEMNLLKSELSKHMSLQSDPMLKVSDREYHIDLQFGRRAYV